MARPDASIDRMLRMSMLLDAYGNLLTEKQRQFMRLHYEQDLSFGEIANDYGVSRQAIHDSVKHAERILENLEQKLSLVNQAVGLDERRETAETILDLKQKIQQQGIIYNSSWILRELTEVVERLMGRTVETSGDAEAAGAEGDPAVEHELVMEKH